MTKETDSYSYEVTLRAVGQALEALGVELLSWFSTAITLSFMEAPNRP